MYQGNKISVAIASYNGEGFIEQQIESILNQSVVPDEIVISDDGSKDETVEIVKNYSQKYTKLPTIVLMTNNPRHGIGGNFEWAIQHCNGDYIFICGQDDIWMPEKVKSVIDVFIAFPDAELVCHDLSYINSENKQISFTPTFTLSGQYKETGIGVMRLTRDSHILSAISGPLISGASICISKGLADKCLPIPMNSSEDQWLEFCAVCDSQFYYINKKLTSYRVHNSSSHSVDLPMVPRLKKAYSRIQNSFSNVNDLILLAESAEQYALLSCPEHSEAKSELFKITNRLREIGYAQKSAASSGRLAGMFKLTSLYCNDQRYRRIGTSYFFAQLLCILIYSRNKRLQMFD